jgi:uncharacterized membrane protein (DUF485 family)
MSSQTKAIDQSRIRVAVAEAVAFLVFYVALIGGAMYQVAQAAGYLG